MFVENPDKASRQDTFEDEERRRNAFPPEKNPSLFSRAPRRREDVEAMEEPNLGSYREEIRMKFHDMSIRHAFVRKVYGILAVQLLFTVGLVAAFVLIEPLRDFSRKYVWISFIGIGLYLVAVLAISCGPARWRRTSPTNYILLATVTLGITIFMTFCVGWYDDPKAFLFAVGTCAVIVLVATLFAFQTKIDVTGMGGCCCVILTIFILLSVAVMISVMVGAFDKNTFKITHIIVASLGVLVFTGYLIYNTQLLLGGNHKYAYDPEEYVAAALQLYLDIILILLYLIEIYALSRN